MCRKPRDSSIDNQVSFFGGAGFHPKTRFAHPHASKPPDTWAAMKGTTSGGAMPAKESDSARAIVTAGLAKDVLAVNQ